MSRLVMQTKFGFGKDVLPEDQGDCTECALAAYFGVPRSEIPQLHQGDSPYKFWGRIEQVFNERGYASQRFNGNFVPPYLYLAAGPTVRGSNHMVVMKQGQLWHDPHPDGIGLTTIDHVFIAVPLDPAMLAAAPKPDGEVDRVKVLEEALREFAATNAWINFGDCRRWTLTRILEPDELDSLAVKLISGDAP